jgi:hypothetical protein
VLADVLKEATHEAREANAHRVLGQVRSVAIEPTRSSTGDDHYPVTIDLLEIPAELRSGMNVRVRFDVVILPDATP